jgi:hypothetical protein
MHVAAGDPACNGVTYFVEEGRQQAKGVAEKCIVENENDADVGCVEDEEGNLRLVHSGMLHGECERSEVELVWCGTMSWVLFRRTFHNH